MKISVLQRLPDGKLVTADALFASMPSPVIKVTEFKIENLRNDPNQKYSYICDVTAIGEVTSSLCDLMPAERGVIEQIRFYHNDSDQPVGTFAVTGSKCVGDNLARPHPFDGRFNFTAKALAVSSGNNTFRIAACDKVYGFDGFSLWAACFAFPYDSEFDDEEDDEGVDEPTIVEGPKFVSGESGGELMLYCIALPVDETPTELTLIAGPRQNTAFKFGALTTGDKRVAMWPGTSSPAFFTVRPTMEMACMMPSDAKMTSSLASIPGITSFSPRERFIYGFAQGLGFEGYDLIFDPDKIILGGARLSKDLRGMVVTVELADATGKRQRSQTVVGPPQSDSLLKAVSSSSTPSLLWHFSNLFRTSDPMAKEMVLALVWGDLSDVGLEGVSIADGRELFYLYICELLEELIKETLTDSELAQGYYLGRGVADALRTTGETGYGRHETRGKAVFLTRLQRMPCFSPIGRRGLWLRIGFIERLKKFITKWR
ncbi:MAG: hypothetical protein KJ070_10935 [Verrucomicrobia bacterium]|nr:hypothetical protein [Verrucomicrobiota bacterium]